MYEFEEFTLIQKKILPVEKIFTSVNFSTLTITSEWLL